MEHGGTAAFFKRPRRAEDLMGLHLLTNEHIFSVAETIELDWIDYENFVTDMLADRQFIEDNAHLCQTGGIWKCLLIKQRGHADGILVMPHDDGCHVGWAAYCREE